jgi:multiple sugar transport system permease protein
MSQMSISAPPKSWLGWRRQPGRWLLVLPLLVGLATFTIYPLVYLVALSLSESLLGAPFSAWVGADNFRDALSDEVFTGSVRRSILFSIPTTFMQVVGGLLVALLLNHAMRGGRMIRTLILLPLITPPIMVATAWKLVFNPTGGLLNRILLDLGVIDRPVSFLGSSQWALPAIALADAWQWTPFVALLSLAALQAVPDDILEAAALDGASTWRRFWSITFPIVVPAIIVIFLVKLIISFKVFDLVYAMTFGGPGFDTNLASFQIYRVGLQQFNVGYAAAQTVIFVIVVSLVTLPIVLLRDRLIRVWT